MSHREAGHNNSERQRDGEEFLGRESVICSGRDVKSGLSDWGDGWVDAAGPLVLSPSRVYPWQREGGSEGVDE